MGHATFDKFPFIAGLTPVLFFLSGCATFPPTQSTTDSILVIWPQWTPVSLALLDFADNEMPEVARESATKFQVPIPAPQPIPVASPPIPDAGTSHSGDTEYVDVGKNVTFVVTADGSPPLLFQWRKARLPIAGATGQRFTIQNASDGDAGLYDCVVTNSAGSAASQTIKLVVGKN